jgi:hypothetical protein
MLPVALPALHGVASRETPSANQSARPSPPSEVLSRLDVADLAETIVEYDACLAVGRVDAVTRRVGRGHKGHQPFVWDVTHHLVSALAWALRARGSAIATVATAALTCRFIFGPPSG